jgi:hypothetical protein
MAKIRKRSSRETRKPKQEKKAPIATASGGPDTPNAVRAALSAAGPDRKKPRA